MSYSLKFASGRQRSAAAVEACVLAHGAVVRVLNASTNGDFDYATPTSGNFFSVFRKGGGGGSGTVSLLRSTMASAACGATVLIDDGTGASQWRLAGVLSDGQQLLAPDGSAIPTATPAALADYTNGQTLPAAGTKMTLTGTASDGRLWFTAEGPVLQQQGSYVTSAPTTIGALASGTLAVVKQSDTLWQVMLL